VEYDDLNLSTSAGADAMLDRLEAASRRVCRSAGSGYRGLERRYARQACAEATLGAAVASLGSPVVTAHYEGAPSAPIVIAAAS
jgi:UrcA family protein